MLRLALLPMGVAAVSGLVGWRQRPVALRYLAGLAIVALGMNAWAFLLMLRQESNLFLVPYFSVAEFGLLTVMYAYSLHSATFTRLAPWLVAGFAAYAILDGRQAHRVDFRPSLQVVQSVLILGLVALYFRQLLRGLTVRRLQREPMFWVSAGLIVYRLGYLQIALFSNYLLGFSNALNMNIWAVHSLLLMVLYSCYCKALWLPPLN